MWLKSKAETYLFYLLANLCSCVHDVCLHKMSWRTAEMPTCPRPWGPNLQWDRFLHEGMGNFFLLEFLFFPFFPFFFPILLFSWKEGGRVMQPVDLHWPRVSFQPSGVDPLVVQISPAADKAAQPWLLIPTRICPCSCVLLPSTPLTFGVACAWLVDTSLLVTEFCGCGRLMETVRIGYIEEFTHFL